jgi:hypothetical protein
LFFAALLNSNICQEILTALSPTLNFEAGTIEKLPTALDSQPEIEKLAEQCISVARDDFNLFETSWNFGKLAILNSPMPTLADLISDLSQPA